MNFYDKYLTNDKPPTHLIMTGGKMHVQNEDVFIDEYHKAILNGSKMSIVEKVDKQLKFKMFLDIDIKEPLENKFEFIQGLLQACDNLKPGCMAIVCVGKNTHGFHVIFQRWNVDSKEANSFVSKLNYDVDTSVFNTGLRMPFSIKGKTNQYYYPKYLFKNSVITTLNTKAEIYDLRLLQGCCIRTKYKTSYTPLQMTDGGSKVNTIITKFIREINDNYKDITILSTKKINNTLCCLTNSRYCMNINSKHSKNHIYFVISNKLMYQKCHCAKYKCDNYKSKGFKVPWVLLEAIKRV